MGLIADLAIGISINATGVQKGIDTAMKSVSAFGKKVGDLGTSMVKTGKSMTMGITVPLLAMGAGAIKVATDLGASAEALSNLSDVTGFSRKSLQEWNYVASSMGLAAGTVDTAIRGLTRRMPELEAETGAGSDALEKLGLTFAQLKAQSPEAMFDTLVERMSAIKDPLERGAIGAKVFGMAWVDVQPILAAGGDEIAALRAEAHELGLVLDDEALDSAQAFDDSWDKAMNSLKGAKNEIALGLMPILSGTLLPMIKDHVVPWIKRMADGIWNLAEWWASLSAATKMWIGVAAGVAVGGGPALVFLGKMAGGVSTLIKVLGFLKANPVYLVVAAIVGLTAAWATSQKGLSGFGDYWKEFWRDLGNSLISMWNWYVGIVEDGVNTIINAINWLTAGILDIPEIELTRASYIESLEATATSLGNIGDEVDDLAEKLGGLNTTGQLDPMLADLASLRELLLGLPIEERAQAWKDGLKFLADQYGSVFPVLLSEATAALEGTTEVFDTETGKWQASVKETVAKIAESIGGPEWDQAVLEFSVGIKLMQDSISEFARKSLIETGTAADSLLKRLGATETGWDKLTKTVRLFVTGAAVEAEAALIEMGERTDDWTQAQIDAQDAAQGLVDDAEEGYADMASSVTESLQRLFDDWAQMRDDNLAAEETYAQSLLDIETTNTENLKTLFDQKISDENAALENLNKALAQEGLTREESQAAYDTYGDEMQRISDEYSKGLIANDKTRMDSIAESDKLLEESKKTFGEILAEMAHDWVVSVRNMLLAEGAKQAAIGLTAGLLGNFVLAGKAALAALVTLGAAVGLVVAGFAEGGIPAYPQLAMVGDAGVPEPIIPLTKQNLAAIGAGVVASMGGGLAAAGAGGGTVEINFYDTTVRNDDDLRGIISGISDVFNSRQRGNGMIQVRR